MSTGEDSDAAELTALRQAILAIHHHVSAPGLPPAIKAAARLQKFKLAWIVLPWLLLDAARTAHRSFRSAPVDTESRAVDLYRALSGKDRESSREVVHRILGHLALLGTYMTARPELEPKPVQPHRPITSAELEAATTALLQFFLADQPTDPLLGEIQAAYAAYETAMGGTIPAFPGQRLRDIRRHERTTHTQQAEALDQYFATWRRWLDQQQLEDAGR